MIGKGELKGRPERSKKVLNDSYYILCMTSWPEKLAAVYNVQSINFVSNHPQNLDDDWERQVQRSMRNIEKSPD